MVDNNEEGGGRSDASSEPRRRLLRTVTAGGTALGLTVLPGKWAKPIVASVILPAHGQTSREGPTCCPGGLTGDSSVAFAGTYTLTATNYPFATYNGSYLEGGTNTQFKYTNLGPCPPQCGGDAVKYAGKYASFDGSGSYQFSYVFGIRCGDYPVVRKYFEYNGTRIGSVSTGTFVYSGTGVAGYELCKYLTENNRALSGAVQGLQSRSRSRGRRFRFGD